MKDFHEIKNKKIPKFEKAFEKYKEILMDQK